MASGVESTEPVPPGVPPELVGREVSVRVLLSLWEAARAKGFSAARLALGTGYSIAQLTNPRERISWAGFFRFLSNLGQLLTDDELVAIGAAALDSPFLRALILPGRMLLGASEIYRWVFGQNGPTTQLFASHHWVVQDLGPGHLRLELRMHPGYPPSRENHLLLLGTLTSMSSYLGAGSARVVQLPRANGAAFDIWVPEPQGVLRFLRARFSWLFAARAAGEELRRAHAELHERYLELQGEIVTRNLMEGERHLLEEQLRQAQKMEAVGRLAGGVAHDFNNLLSVILSYSTILSRGLKPSDPRWEQVEEIRKAGEHAAVLTRQLLAFSRQQILEPRIVDLNEVIGEVDKLLQRLIGEDIELVTRPGVGLGSVHVDPGQMKQVLLNLAVNARDAMPRGGKLILETENVELDEAYARDHLGVVPGRHVMMMVRDTGVGMDQATQARIFEPFFTTKEHGKGTGLGLSTVLGIVQQSRGSLWVSSELGQGTTFKIFLPRVDAAPQVVTPLAPAITRGTETILLVEDQPQVLTVVRGILEHNGYRVLEARSGTEALVRSQEHPGPIHLLLTDVVMPIVSGPQLAAQLLPLRPELKVLYMSGYPDNAIGHQGVLEPGVAFIQKPLTPEALLEKVRSVLG